MGILKNLEKARSLSLYITVAVFIDDSQSPVNSPLTIMNGIHVIKINVR